MSAFDFEDYKKLIRNYIRHLPRRGRGEMGRIAKALNIHTTMVSHILSGTQHLSPEQSIAMADHMGLDDLETEFFIFLVQLNRAGNERSRIYFKGKLSKIREKALNLSARLETKNNLDDRGEAIFYSSWTYSAIRLLTAIDGLNNKSSLANVTGLYPEKVQQILKFLLSSGLCKEIDGQIHISEMQTYVSQDSAFVGRHHANWRTKALEQLERPRITDLHYTHPIVVSDRDFKKIREEIVSLIESFIKIAGPSDSEQLACLNIDWMRIG